MAKTAVLSKGFRISIPREISGARDWHPGQRFAFLPKGAGVLLLPVQDPGDLAGIAKGATADHFRDRKNRF
jgi:hypothetical protein